MTNPDALLEIKQAAEFLAVSETSLRRWTSAGRLACVRIGSRGDRRFRRSDLLAFLRGQGAPLPAGADEGLDASRILQQAGPLFSHVHACAFYTSPEEQARQAAAFFADGLREGSRCFHVGESAAHDAVSSRVEGLRVLDGSDLGRSHAALACSSYANDSSSQIRYWQTALAEAVGSGCHGLRVAGDVSSAPFASAATFEEVLTYEVEYDRNVALPFPVVTLCQYDVRRLSAAQALQLLALHGGRAVLPDACSWDGLRPRSVAL